MTTEIVTVTLTRISCGQCGGCYAVDEHYRATKEANGGFWTCPYCACSWGYGDSAVKRAERALAQERARHDQTRADRDYQREVRKKAERREIAQKAAKTRIKNRIANGVCPCCKRHFANLGSHMKGKHPEFGGSE